MRRMTSPVLMIRGGADHLVTAPDIGGDIINMYATEDGTLRSIWGPCPYVPKYGATGAPDSSETSCSVSPLTYGPMRGIHHAVIQNNREILLVHTHNELWVFEGWNRAWKRLIGPPVGVPAPKIIAELPNDTANRFPTQFESTPTGVIIIPQTGRSYFYDGEVIAEFGYHQAPSAPTGLGPHSSSSDGIGRYSGLHAKLNDYDYGYAKNDLGYSHDARVEPRSYDVGNPSAMSPFFGKCRVGSVESQQDELKAGELLSKGKLLPGRYRCKVQWIDRWGNLSPASPPSNNIEFDRQVSFDRSTAGPASYPRALSPDRALKQIAWSTIERGGADTATVGRMLLRTRDLLNSGTARYFEIPGNAAGGTSEFATIMDNSTVFFPDNVPDSWLISEETEVMAMPDIHLAKLAFGRCWVAYGGTVHPSIAGRYGTLEKGQEIIPDAQGRQITAMYPVTAGLLVCTETSTFIIIPSDDGRGYRYQTLHPKAGCVAPNSMRTMADGMVVWLGREGFYAFQNGQVSLVSGDKYLSLRDRNMARQRASVAAYDPKERTYRCWVPTAGSRLPDRCYVWNGDLWTERDDVQASGVCVTQDHTNHMLVAGKREGAGNGVWLLDHENVKFLATNTASLETSWLKAMSGDKRTSPKKVLLWLRESSQSTITVEAMRDWREEVIYTDSRTLRYWPSDVPTFIGAELGSSGARWEHRRPYYTAVAIDLPSCEVFKIRISGTGHWEFIGLSFQDVEFETFGARAHQ
jgi:hypothetical protein